MDKIDRVAHRPIHSYSIRVWLSTRNSPQVVARTQDHRSLTNHRAVTYHLSSSSSSSANVRNEVSRVKQTKHNFSWSLVANQSPRTFLRPSQSRGPPSSFACSKHRFIYPFRNTQIPPANIKIYLRR